MYSIETATDPQFANAEKTRVRMNVKFNERSGIFPYLAAVDDIVPISRVLFDMAVKGNFGPVADYVPPPPPPEPVTSKPAVDSTAKPTVDSTNQ